MVTDYEERLHNTLFERGLGARAALYAEPGEDLDVAGVACRVLISSRDDVIGGESVLSAPMKTRVTIIEVRVRELIKLGVTAVEPGGRFRITTPDDELTGIEFEVQEEPLLEGASRRIVTCKVVKSE
ncbi:hypothetical protein [Maricaulis maris]|uniref:hypothetical protein n=1 Tax=Maricaulis maris TaxID=74318 RepID=UPI003B8AF1DB